MQKPVPDHYAALGLHRRCDGDQIRAAYRLLAKRHHPDLNVGSPEAVAHTQALNDAYETLGDPERRQAYDLDLADAEKALRPVRTGKIERDLSQDVYLRPEELLRGASLQVRVNDPANLNGTEAYDLIVPPGTAPGARFRLSRPEPFRGGVVNVRLRVRPDFRFKVRGSDLRCDLRISAQRAAQGGFETVRGLTGGLRVKIPRGVGRGEILRIPGEGLPKKRGDRGDLLVRVTYRPEVRIIRASRR